jgi:protocatechuate 3,4-dioxygenase beta subunit
VDDAGEPMMGVNVSVLHKPSEEELEDAGPRRKKVELTMVSGGQTDDRGEYRIFNIEPGEYYVKAADTAERWGIGGMTEPVIDWRLKEELGSLFAPNYYPGVLQLDQAQAITLSAGEEAQADFAMRKIKMVEVAGRVIGPDGGPASRVYVQLSQTGIEDWGGELRASVDSNGEFSVKGVAPGSYIISAGMNEKDKYYNTQQKIEVGEAKIDSLVLTLGTGATIHGRIRTANGAPLPLTRSMVHLVSVADEGATGFGGAEVNKDGTFELSGVADGTYAVMAWAGGEGWFVKSAHLGNEDVQQNGLLVENGAVKGSLDIAVSNDGAQIEGTVTDSDKGQPLAGVVVKAQVDPSTDYNWMRSRSATTDQNGHYVLKDIPPNKYKVTAKMPKPTAALPVVKSEPVTVTLADHDHRVMDLKLTLPKSE